MLTPTTKDFVVTVFLLIAVYRVHKFWEALKHVNFLPGMRPLFTPLIPISVLLPTTRWNPGIGWHWKWRKTAYFNRTHEVISVIPLLLGRSVVYISSLSVMKQVFGQEQKIGLNKPRYLSAAFMLWGDNLIASDNQLWKRHRKIVSPAISNRTYELVVNETLATCKELQEAEGWNDQQELSVKDIHNITLKKSLLEGHCRRYLQL
ncbi:hypothetical protein C8Q75DRAFT_232476 [Abortiporus biennis]|nr:hypothetical protein C8Q75DRAFT_232476 [Abortiporus biennis]